MKLHVEMASLSAFVWQKFLSSVSETVLTELCPIPSAMTLKIPLYLLELHLDDSLPQNEKEYFPQYWEYFLTEIVCSDQEETKRFSPLEVNLAFSKLTYLCIKELTEP